MQTSYLTSEQPKKGKRMNDKRKKMLLDVGWHSLKYILTIVFCVLKLCGVINWNWIWVLSPLILSLTIKVFVFVILSFFVCVAPRWLEWLERWDE